MKKVMSVAFAALLVVAMSATSVKAANSPTAEDVATLANSVEVENEQGSTSELSLDSVLLANNTLRSWIVGEFQAKGNPTSIVDGNTLVLNDDGTPLGAAAEPELVAAFDFIPSASVQAEIAKKGYAWVTFDVADVKSTDYIKVIHFLEDSGTYEILVDENVIVEDGKVKAGFTSFSPIIIAKVPSELAPAPVQSSSNYAVFFIVGGIAVVAAGGATVFGLSKRK